MFGFDKPEDGSEDRFHERIKNWSPTKRLPVAQHYAWWLIHNVVAHPLIGVAPIKMTFQFHDWTSRKLNGL